MIKNTLHVVFSWLVSLGIYYELPIAYGAYWVVSSVMLILILLSSLYIGSATEEVIAQIKEGFYSWGMVAKLVLCTPAFLYAVILSSSWNTLGLWVVLTACMIGFLFHMGSITKQDG